MTSLYRSVVFLLSVAAIQVQGGKDDQNQPELQQPTQQADSSSVRPKLPRPTRLPHKKLTHHLRQEANEEKYSRFNKCEDKYLKTDYSYLVNPGMSRYGDDMQVATLYSDSSEVLFKTIGKGVDFYQLESIPPPIPHMATFLRNNGLYFTQECKLPEPSDLLLPLEVEMQKYLTQPGYGSPHVLQIIDYVVTKNEYMLVMEYPGKEWITLDRYMTEQGKLSVYDVRFIASEALKALLSLKTLGIFHGDIAEKNVLYNEDTSDVKLINFGYSGLLEEWNQGSSESGSSDEKPDFWGTEEIDLAGLGKLMYRLLTLEDANQYPGIRGRVEEKLRKNLRRPDSQISIDVMDLVHILLGQGPYEMATLEDALKHPFFTSQ
ncbi:hypothetical protein BASA61_004902 [Batrachochytrium salamandrivorans]|nr:hypothetical protein BASA61_004902 [Batrachochytrium salamandrivorans]